MVVRNYKKFRYTKYALCFSSVFVVDSAFGSDAVFEASYTVAKGDCISSIAQVFSNRAGKKIKYSDIYNKLLSDFSKTGRDPALIDVGEKIKLSFKSEETIKPEVLAKSDKLTFKKEEIVKQEKFVKSDNKESNIDSEYIVKKGDTLYDIAKYIMPKVNPLGRYGGIQKLLDLNPKIGHQDRIIEGLIINIPENFHHVANSENLRAIAEEKNDSEAEKAIYKKYKVILGDSISSIANEIVGKQNLYGPLGGIECIKELNPKLNNVHLIAKGLVIKVPTIENYFKWREKTMSKSI